MYVDLFRIVKISLVLVFSKSMFSCFFKDQTKVPKCEQRSIILSNE